MTRIVLDTNLLIAALVEPTGASASLVDLWRRGQLEMITSGATRREAELVLGGRWLRRVASEEDRTRLLRDLAAHTLHVDPGEPPDLPLRDEGDRNLVAAADAGEAAYLVTSDREVLAQRGYRGVEFVTAPELLRRISGKRVGPS